MIDKFNKNYKLKNKRCIDGYLPDTSRGVKTSVQEDRMYAPQTVKSPTTCRGVVVQKCKRVAQ